MFVRRDLVARIVKKKPEHRLRGSERNLPTCAAGSVGFPPAHRRVWSGHDSPITLIKGHKSHGSLTTNGLSYTCSKIKSGSVSHSVSE